MFAVGAFQYDVINYNRTGSVSLTNTQEVQVMLKTMTRELRSMESGADGAYPIAAAATSSVTFYADVNHDNLKEKIRYYVGTTTSTLNTVYRGVINPTGIPATYNPAAETRTILVTGVRVSSTTPLFQYFDGMYSGTTTPMTYPLNLTSIRLVKITMPIDTDPNRSPIIRVYTTQAELRNLKDNL
jgi:hypothetical protein